MDIQKGDFWILSLHLFIDIFYIQGFGKINSIKKDI